VAEFQISKESESCLNSDSAVWLFSEMPSWNHSEVPIQNVVWMVKCGIEIHEYEAFTFQYITKIISTQHICM
jgi:hypothetical protein